MTALASWSYTDPARYDREMRGLFDTAWTPAGSSDGLEAAGDHRAAEVAGEPILLARDETGTVRALSAVCRHRAGPVGMPGGRRGSLQCAYHGWTYGLDGRLLAAPDCPALSSTARDAAALPRFETDVAGPIRFVRLRPGGASLAAWLAPIAARCGRDPFEGMRPAAMRRYSVACNWKVYVENFLEGYHIPIVHPGLHRLLDYDAYRTEPIEGGCVQVAPLREGDDGALYFWLFPAFMLNVYPGSLSTNLVVPRSAGLTDVLFEWYVPCNEGEAGLARLAAAIDLSDRVQQEDASICEAVQRGLGSRWFAGAAIEPGRETGIKIFHQMLSSTVAPIPQEPPS